MSNSDQSFSSASTEKKTFPRKQLKRKYEKIERKLSKEQKAVTSGAKVSGKTT